jgi:hypothetical protein
MWVGRSLRWPVRGWAGVGTQKVGVAVFVRYCEWFRVKCVGWGVGTMTWRGRVQRPSVAVPSSHMFSDAPHLHSLAAPVLAPCICWMQGFATMPTEL